jgi:hypothetical protein
MLDDLDDDALIARFEALAVPPAAFDHRGHVRLAFAMLRGADFGEAAVRFRRSLRQFAEAAGAPDKVHETLTWAYLSVIATRMARDPMSTTSQQLLARHPDLLERGAAGALSRHYDVGAVAASALARRVFVLPNR